MRRAFLILILLALIPLANAEILSYKKEQTTQEYFKAPQGYVIYSIYANNILFDDEWQTQTFILNAFGQTYVLEVKARGEGIGGAWRHFYVNLTYPNGTIESKELNKFWPYGGDYDLRIQYYVMQIDTPFDLDVYVYLNPLDAYLEQPATTFELGDFVTFNEIMFSSTTQADVEIYYSTVEDWAETVEAYENGSVVGIVGDVGEQILTQMEDIPYLGELVAIFEAVYWVVTGVYYYFKLIFVDNGLLTFALFEALVLAWASGTSSNIFTFYRKYIRMHRALFEFLLDIIKGIIEIFHNVIDAMKPKI